MCMCVCLRRLSEGRWKAQIGCRAIINRVPITHAECRLTWHLRVETLRVSTKFFLLSLICRENFTVRRKPGQDYFAPEKKKNCSKGYERNLWSMLLQHGLIPCVFRSPFCDQLLRHRRPKHGHKKGLNHALDVTQTPDKIEVLAVCNKIIPKRWGRDKETGRGS